MKNFLFVFSVCLVAISCSKKDDAPSNTDTDLLTKSAWKIDALGIDATGDGTIDQSIKQDCMNDDRITFATSGNLTYAEGPVVCDPSFAGTYPWTLKNKVLNTKLSDMFQGNLTVQTLTATNMVLTKDTTYLTLPVKVIVQLSH